MSVGTSRVKNMLDRSIGNDHTTDESYLLSRSEVKEAAREGASEALQEEGRSQPESESETEQESTAQSESASRSGRSLKGALIIGAIAAVSYFVRRRRRQQRTSPVTDSTEV